jgi:DNA-binding MarR family transcriptional regulator
VAAQAQSLVPEEADVIARVAGLPVDLAAMAVAANVWRAAQAVRGHLERTVLRAEGLSWAGFSALFNLWVWDAMETRALARSMGVARPTVSGVIDTLQARGLVQRTGDARDRRLCRVALTAAGRETIEELFPRFNRGEAAVTGGLTDDEKATLAALLRRVIAAAKEDA